MRITRDAEYFYNTVEPIFDYEMEFIDIVPNADAGFFDKHRLSELMIYCKSNPEYHVISKWGLEGITINAPISNAGFYMLARGNSDPSLVYIRPNDEDSYATLQTLKFQIG
jgi:hypothetical protein